MKYNCQIGKQNNLEYIKRNNVLHTVHKRKCNYTCSDIVITPNRQSNTNNCIQRRTIIEADYMSP